MNSRELILRCFSIFDVSIGSSGWNLALWRFFNIEDLLHHTRPEQWTLPYTLGRIKPLQTYIHFRHLLWVSRDHSGFRKTTDTKLHQHMFPDTQKAVRGCVVVHVDRTWRLLMSVGVWCCLLLSYVVWGCEEGVWGVSQRVSECCLWTCVRFWCIWGC